MFRGNPLVDEVVQDPQVVQDVADHVRLPAQIVLALFGRARVRAEQQHPDPHLLLERVDQGLEELVLVPVQQQIRPQFQDQDLAARVGGVADEAAAVEVFADRVALPVTACEKRRDREQHDNRAGQIRTALVL